jgi:hypothetical protein
MPSATWQVLIDTNGDNIGDLDITPWVKKLDCHTGFRQPNQHVAGENSATIVLDNTDRRFSPENPSGVFYNQYGLNLVFITANGLPQFRGFWDSIQPQWGINRERECVITATGPQRFFDTAQVELPIYKDLMPYEILIDMQHYWGLPRYRDQQWVLDAPNASTLDTSTVITYPISLLDFEGSAPIPYTGDTWGKGVNILQALQQIALYDRGRLFVGINNDVVFWGRIQLIQSAPIDATWSNNFHEADYVWGENLANVIRIGYRPRLVSDDNNEILWTLDEEITLAPGETKTITANYTEQGSDTRIAGEDFIVPSVGNGNLVASPSTIGVTGFEGNARSARITIENSGVLDATLTLLRLRGRKISTNSVNEVVLRDPVSIAQYGAREYSITIDLIADAETAQGVAEYELYLRKDPIGEFKSVTFYNQNQAVLDDMVGLGTGFTVQVTETQTGHTGTYLIIGISHSLTDAFKLQKTTFYLQRKLDTVFWQLGTTGLGELGTNTNLAF